MPDFGFYDFFVAPFVDYLFLRRALMACLSIAISSGPVGVLLVLRRLSLMGDALSHAILPGIAVGYLLTGMWLPALTLGGIIAGMIVAMMGGLITRKTILTEDASFTGFYIISLAMGVLILSVKGGTMNLTHFLFGSVLAVDFNSLLFIITTTALTVMTLLIIYRPLIYECFDPVFVKMIGIQGQRYHLIFLGLVVVNLVAACQALGTLMALGIMMLPAITARLLVRRIGTLFALAIAIALISGYVGLLLSYHLNWPSGPTIILVAGVAYGAALLFHRRGS
jgi:zinc/manganese transport system permease protein